MFRYNCDASGAMVQEPNGAFVAWTDIQAFQPDAHKFVDTLLDMALAGELTKEDALKSLDVYLKMTIEWT